MNLILCPLKIELKAFLNTLKEKGYVASSEQVKNQTIYKVKELNLICAEGGHGKVQFAIQSQFLVDSLKNIKNLICFGMAGSLNKNVKVFDVVIATKTIEHDYHLKFIKQNQPEVMGDIKLIEKLQKLNLNTKFKLHFGPIASGDEDILEAIRVQELEKKTKALAVAWEGIGGGKVARFNKISFLEIRGISDMADENTVNDFKTNLPININNMFSILESLLLDKNIS
jgi:adenosylhomocysteine nucleosidase